MRSDTDFVTSQSSGYINIFEHDIKHFEQTHTNNQTQTAKPT